MSLFWAAFLLGEGDAVVFFGCLVRTLVAVFFVFRLGFESSLLSVSESFFVGVFFLVVFFFEAFRVNDGEEAPVVGKVASSSTTFFLLRLDRRGDGAVPVASSLSSADMVVNNLRVVVATGAIPIEKDDE